jgi:hypothetical protein
MLGLFIVFFDIESCNQIVKGSPHGIRQIDVVRLCCQMRCLVVANMSGVRVAMTGMPHAFNLQRLDKDVDEIFTTELGGCELNLKIQFERSNSKTISLTSSNIIFH